MSDVTESSLPKEAAHPFFSSPPRLTQYSTSAMDDDLESKYKPIAPQEVQQTPKRRKHKRINSDDTERPASAQRDRDDSEQHSDIEVEQKLPDDDEADPAAQIADFDWEHLHQRYHDAIKTCSDEEAELMQEWSNLMEVLMSPFWTT